jgi:hypothetical protein
MSGGSMNYLYFRVKEDAFGMMADAELNELMEDISTLLHDCEWWHSGDYGEDDYRRSVAKFKAKWFGKSAHRSKRLEKLIDEKIEQVRKECRQMIGFVEEEDDG